jgi:hypothetical protein
VLTAGNPFSVTWDSSGIAAGATPTPTTAATAPGTGIPPGRHHTTVLAADRRDRREPPRPGRARQMQEAMALDHYIKDSLKISWL